MARREWLRRPRVGADRLAVAATLLLAAISTWRPAVGQVTWDDEALQGYEAQRMLDVARDFGGYGSARTLADLFSLQEHPPLRFVLSMLGLALFPASELGLRLGAVVGSVAMTYVLIRLGREVGGAVVGLGAGVLVAASAVFNWTSMAFGWSLIVVAIVQSIRILRVGTLELDGREQRRLWRVHAWLALAFLVNTGAAVFAATAFGIYAYANRRRVGRVLRAHVAPAAFYAAYFLWFGIVAPWWTPSGSRVQLEHLRGRGSLAGLNYESLLENLRGVNAYLFPVLGLALVAAGVAYVARREPRILFFVAPYALLWSFYLRLNSQSYFLLVCVALIPYAVAQLVPLVRERYAVAALAGVAVVFAAWNYTLFWRVYSAEALPRRPLEITWSEAVVRHNVVEPWHEVQVDLDRVLGDDGLYVQDVGTPLGIYYYNRDDRLDLDRRNRARLGDGDFQLVPDVGGGCLHVTGPEEPRLRAVVARAAICGEGVGEAFRYPGSRIVVYELIQER